MKNTKDTCRMPTEKRWLSVRGSGLVRLLLLALTITFVLGCQDCNLDNSPPTLTCLGDITLTLEPGACVPLPNPCSDSGDWIAPPRTDGFRLCFTPEQATFFADGRGPQIITTRSGGVVTRTLCIPSNSPFYSLSISFTYGIGPQFGTGQLSLKVAPRLTVEVAAAPSNIAVGQSSQLVAIARGGVPPYFYSWAPRTLNDSDIAAPIARPNLTTEYRVLVTDSLSQQVTDTVTVSVGLELTVTAIPSQISVGDVSVLLALPRGGTPPYTYLWTPALTLDDPLSLHPTSRATTTTTYHVTVTDSEGATGQGSATVSVNLGVTATGDPLFIQQGAASQLNAIGVGGSQPYTYSWTPAGTLDRPSDPNPIATPTTSTTYQVLMRDSAGAAAASSVLVNIVDSAPPPTASFVFNVLCCPTINLDASASTGNIVSYTWDLGWTSANPDRLTTSPTTSFTIMEFDRGTITLTVTDASGRTATTTRTF